ncbi:MAG: hypothetical protein OYH76_22745, partial [Defluviicoccus sp.]|nr:hypothetical protein [Defluviicoccus sp.]MDE0278724.1 hypothetical protein [Defluviicoccus sp.]
MRRIVTADIHPNPMSDIDLIPALGINVGRSFVVRFLHQQEVPLVVIMSVLRHFIRKHPPKAAGYFRLSSVSG